MDVEAGTRIGRYRLDVKLAEGGHAVIWKGADMQSGRPVALKVVRADDPEQRSRLLREARVQAGLRVPNIVQVLDFMLFEDSPVIVLEYVDGHCLRSFLRGSVVTLEEVDLLVRGIFAGVRAAHAAGLVHRDLKPGNILISGTGLQMVPRLIDFGLVRELGRGNQNAQLTATGFAMGTPGYMSPEQIRGHSDIDQRADIFALGSILYQLCTGERAFVGVDRFEVLRRTCDGEYHPPRSINNELPDRMVAAIHAALIVNRDHRVPNVDALEALWDGTLKQGITVPIELFSSRSVEVSEAKGLSGLFDVSRDASGSVAHLKRKSDKVLVGREGVVMDLLKHIRHQPLVTITGLGGVGKTRVAKEVARRIRSHGQLDVRYLDLVGAHDAADVMMRIGESLGISVDSSHPQEQLFHALSARSPALLVLDGIERVESAIRKLIVPWIDGIPNLRILLVSRCPTRISGEQSICLHGLAPAEAVQLFMDHARRRHVDLNPSTDERDPIHSICERLDFNPLAIELAAARMPDLSANAILSRIDKRFELLRSSGTGRPGRQATLEKAIDWSWDLLRPWERLVWAQCSVFEEGFTIEAAEEVTDLMGWPGAPWAMEIVHVLVDHSVLHFKPGRDGARRLFMPESIRAYGIERLARKGAVYGNEGNSLTGHQEANAIRHRHMRYFGALGLPKNLARVETVDAYACVQDLLIERANIEAARVRAHESGNTDVQAYCALALATLALWVGSASDGTTALRQALAANNLEPRLRGRLLEALGIQLGVGGDYQESLARRLGALAICKAVGDVESEGRLHYHVSCAYRRLGLEEEALEHAWEALYIGRKMGKGEVEGLALSQIACVLMEHGRMDRSLECLQRALTIQQRCGLVNHQSLTLEKLGLAFWRMGKFDESLVYYNRAIVLAESREQKRHLGNLQGNIATVYAQSGDMVQAEAKYQAALQCHRENGSHPNVGVVLMNLAMVYSRLGKRKRAITTLQESLDIHREVGDRRFEAMTLGNMGDVLMEAGLLDEAEGLLVEAISLGDEIHEASAGAFRGSLALLRAVEGRFDEAIGLLDSGYRKLSGAYRFEQAKLMVKRVRVLHLWGRRAEALNALSEVETIAAALGCKPGTEVGVEILAARRLLHGPEVIRRLPPEEAATELMDHARRARILGGTRRLARAPGHMDERKKGAS